LEGVSTKSWVTPTVLSNIIDQTFSIVSARSRFTECDDGLGDGDTALDGVDRLRVSGLAGTSLDIIHNHAFSVGTTWVWLTLFHRFHTWNGRRVSFKSG